MASGLGVPPQTAQRALLAAKHDNTTNTADIQFPITEPKKDPSRTMLASLFKGSTNVKAEAVPKVDITEPRDAVVHITATTVCGSDLHLYHREFMGLRKDSIIGHEAMGIVEAVGPAVKDVKVGDRVVISAVIACGDCQYCKRQEFSCCDRTNPSKEMEKMYGHRTGGIFGYSDMLGGYPGCQAEFVRVPIADINLLKVPSDVPDDQALFLSDILPTSWHANELANVQEGDSVCIWGAGPIGLLSAYWAKFRGASKVAIIDSVKYRLDVARDKMGVETIDRSVCDVVDTVQRLFPGGPDCCIDATGFRYATGIHRVARAVGLETDTPEVVNECITCCRKNGRLALIADYYSYTNGFNLGALMEKGIILRGGQLWCQKYWKQILDWLREGRVSVPWIVSHHMPLSDIDKAYKIFDEKSDNVLKIILHP